MNKSYKQNHIPQTHNWIDRSRMLNMIGKSDDRTYPRRVKNCIPRSLLKKAQALEKSSGDFDEFLGRLCQVFPSLRNDGCSIYLELSVRRCRCPIVRFYPSLRFPPTWCACGTDWAQLFESASGRPAKAELERSVLQGDDVCRVRVMLTR